MHITTYTNTQESANTQMDPNMSQSAFPWIVFSVSSIDTFPFDEK